MSEFQHNVVTKYHFNVLSLTVQKLEIMTENNEGVLSLFPYIILYIFIPSHKLSNKVQNE